jgi:hypothetical protein
LKNGYLAESGGNGREEVILVLMEVRLWMVGGMIQDLVH